MKRISNKWQEQRLQLATELLAKKRQERAVSGEEGFTLVELAIVLVIIGLIIGGALTGQDLIRSAEIRATIQQIEGYNTAVNTFRSRFNGIPGDIRNATSFFAAATWPNLVNGDGDRLIEACGAAPSAAGACAAASGFTALATASPGSLLGGEEVQFWHHLSAAELVPGLFDGLSYVSATSGGQLELTFPRSRMGAGGIGVYTANGQNYYQLGIASSTGAAAAATYLAANGLTPEQAFNIDGRVDDGRPNAGAVRAMSGTAPNTALAGTSLDFATNPTTACQTEATATATSTYATLNTNRACQLRFKAN